MTATIIRDLVQIGAKYLLHIFWTTFVNLGTYNEGFVKFVDLRVFINY